MIDWAIQTSFLGDAVLSLPFLHRHLESGRDLLLVCAPRNAQVFERAKAHGLRNFSSRIHLRLWDKAHVKSPRTIWKLVKEICGQYGRPDRVYCLQRSFSSALFALLSGSKHRVGFSTGAASFLYTDLVPRNWDTGQLEIEKNLDLLRRFSPCAPWAAEAPSLLGQRYEGPSGIVAFSLGSPWATKEWDLGHALVLMRTLLEEGRELWLLGDKNYEEKGLFLEKNLESKLVKNYVARTNISEWIDLISKAAVLVSGDSAALHVASDLGVPAIAIFGPTIPEFGFAPWRKNAQVLSLDLPCRPCDIHGPKRCPLGHHRCMKDLRPEWVLATIKKYF